MDVEKFTKIWIKLLRFREMLTFSMLLISRLIPEEVGTSNLLMYVLLKIIRYKTCIFYPNVTLL